MAAGVVSKCREIIGASIFVGIVELVSSSFLITTCELGVCSVPRSPKHSRQRALASTLPYCWRSPRCHVATIGLPGLRARAQHLRQRPLTTANHAPTHEKESNHSSLSQCGLSRNAFCVLRPHWVKAISRRLT